MAKRPTWHFYGHKYPYNQQELDIYNNPHSVPRLPLKLVAGMKINYVLVLHIEREKSEAMRDYKHYGLPGNFRHLKGPVHCKCLLCSKPFVTHFTRLHPNRPEKSLWSCGCQRRPQGLGAYAIESARRKEDMARKTYEPPDLTDRRFGYTEPFEWIRGKGWLCYCHHCGNTAGFFVRDTQALIQNMWRACGRCMEVLKPVFKQERREMKQVRAEYVDENIRRMRENRQEMMERVRELLKPRPTHD
jgi:hypothetical protein